MIISQNEICVLDLDRMNSVYLVFSFKLILHIAGITFNLTQFSVMLIRSIRFLSVCSYSHYESFPNQ